VRFASAGLRPGANRRQRGEELATGATALPAGTRLGPAELGLAAGLGPAQLTVRRRLRVALFSTGDEPLQPGEAARTGAIYDSNRFALAAALQQLGCTVHDLGAVRDEPAALRAALQHAAQDADVILTSGGVSSGDADHTQTLLAELGDVAFLCIAMRPGRPLAVGRMHRADGRPGALLLGLPGNPVATLLSFALLARPALLQAMGMDAERATPALVQVPLAVPLRKRAGRTEFVRATLHTNAQGQVEARPTGNQSSAMLSSLVQADALLLLDHHQAIWRQQPWSTRCHCTACYKSCILFAVNASMAYTDTATLPEPTAEAVQALPGLVLLEFGTDWCPHCLGAQDAIRKVLAPRDDIQHIKVEDGPGRRLGRLFRVKLCPRWCCCRTARNPQDRAATGRTG
jgi:molybdenum cofactor synthesis domain-containing protein